MNGHILILGAGHAGGSAAAMLRQNGWTGPITLVGEEPLPPYQRPPLSKGWIAGEPDLAGLLLRPESFYGERDISLRLGRRAIALDTSAHRATLDDGTTLPYDTLILATGSRLRPLPVPGADLPGVFSLRSVADAQRIRDALTPGGRLVLVGGGYVGLEVAASARRMGAEVTVLEREPRLLARVASQTLSDFFTDLHRSHGVRIDLGMQVAAFEPRDGRVGAVRLTDARVMPCDAVVVGIGALAEDTLASQAGVTCEDGILVDDACRTSIEAIYAIGDCTRRPVPRYARRLRLESVPNALEQARQVAAHLCGKPAPRIEAPWFWSDQYEARLQIAGMPFDVVRTVVRGDAASGRFSVFHLGADDMLQCVEAVSSPQEFVAGKMLVGTSGRLDPVRLADGSSTIKDAIR